MKTHADPKELGDALTVWRNDAAALRRSGDERAARILERCADDASAVADEYLTWLSEEDAARRSGWSLLKVRRSITLAFQHTEHVRKMGRNRYQLRACIVPRRQHFEMLRADAQKAAS